MHEREKTQPGTGDDAAPPREGTFLGVGGSKGQAAQAAPIVAVAPARERTVLGVGGASPASGARPIERERSVQEPPPEEGWDLPEEQLAQRAQPSAESAAAPEVERSVALDLVTKKPAADTPPREASEPASPPVRRRGRRWPAVLLILATGAVGVYAFRDRIPWAHVRSWVGASSTSPAP